MPNNKRILLLGIGGHCSSVLDSLISLKSYDTIGLVDKEMLMHPDRLSVTSSFMGISIVGGDDDLVRLYSEGYTDAFITVGSIGDVILRKKLYHKLKEIGFYIPNIIDKSSNVSGFSSLGEGIFIGKRAVVNANTKIGNCAIINTSSVIEHDCKIREFVHIAPGSILCGNVQIDNGTHIGARSVIKQGVHIGSNTMIGMGSVVLSDMPNNITAYGNPCKEVNHE